MWFLFGLITLISFCAFKAYKNLNASWDGVTGKSGELDYQYKFSTNKDDEITQILVGIDAPEALDFVLKKEGSFDRFFKNIGLAAEHQIGHDKFDDLIYIISDDKVLNQYISDNQEFIDTGLRLFSDHLNLKKLRCHSGRVWLELDAPMGFESNQMEKLASSLVPLLKTISSNLEKLTIPKTSKWRNPFAIKAAIILAISSGLLLNGVVQYLRLSWIDIPFVVDFKSLLVDSILMGSLVVLALIGIALLFLGRSSRTHLVLIEILLVGSIGAISTTYAQVRDFNIVMDESEPQVFEVSVHRKRESRTRRSRSYYLYVDDWSNETKTKKIEVGSSLFDSVYTGNVLRIVQRDGYLGYQWVESVKKIH